MKKKIIYGLIGLLSCGLCVCNLDAEELEAKVPATIPDVNSPVYAGVSSTFNFRRIKFKSTTGDEIKGKEDFRKIFLTATKPSTEATDFETALGDKYFSGYCLDGDKKLPEYNTLTFANGGNNENKVLFALLNDSKLNSAFEKVADAMLIKEIEFHDDTPIDSFDFDETIKIKAVIFKKDSLSEDIKVTAADLDNAKNSKTDSTAETYDLIVKEEDIKLSNYTTTANTTNKYDKALWISDHSYPSISIEEMYKNAGTNYTNALAELAIINAAYGASATDYDAAVDTTAKTIMNSTKDAEGNEYKDALFPNKTITYLEKQQQALLYLDKCAKGELESSKDMYLQIKKGLVEQLGNTYENIDITPTVCKEVVDEYMSDTNFKNYTYAVVQYAIWKVSDGKTAEDGGKLGDELIGSSELNKLYQYLIKDREETNNYSSFVYDNSINLVKPSKEIFKDEKDYYIYGPYNIKANVLSLNKVELSVVGDTKGVSFVDKDGNAITEVKENEEFYIKTMKSDKVANVSINAKALYSTYENNSRIYYSNPRLQNVITGGKTVSSSSEKKFDMVYNPKTGVKNLAVIFVISLVAFTIGYIVLNSKDQEINFD